VVGLAPLAIAKPKEGLQGLKTELGERAQRVR
jgi:hypothetical protein